MRLIGLSQELQVVAMFENFDIVHDVNRRSGADQCADDQNDVTKTAPHDEDISMGRDFRQCALSKAEPWNSLLDEHEGAPGGSDVTNRNMERPCALRWARLRRGENSPQDASLRRN